MRTILLKLLMVFLIILAVFAAALANAQNITYPGKLNMKEYVSEKYKISIGFPSHWSLDTPVRNEILLAGGELRGNNALCFVRVSEVEYLRLSTPEKFFAITDENAFIKMNSISMPDIKVHLYDIAYLSDRKARRIAYSGTESGIKMGSISYQALDGDRIFTVSCVSEASAFQLLYADFLSVIASFRFRIDQAERLIQTSSTPVKPDSSAGRARDTWINQMTTYLPAGMCKKDQVFRRCFRISPAECEETAASAARICLNQYREQIPSMLDSKSGSQWASIVGECAGKNFSFVLNKKFINNRHCKDSNFCIELRKAAENIMAQRYKGQSAATLNSGTDDKIMHAIINSAFEKPYITSSYADQLNEITDFGNRMFDICVDPEQVIFPYADQQNANN